jgi:F-type H+-transporting ATPase subunit delta
LAHSSSASQTLSRRYATALIGLATEQGQLDKMEADILALQNMIETSKDLSQALSNKGLNQSKQLSLMADIAAKAQFHPMTQKFLGVICQNRRLDQLPSILKSVRHMLSQQRGEVQAKIVSAQALSPEQEKSLQESLRKSMGFQVHLDMRVDPTLLGGMVITIGSKMIDDSVRTKLERLKSVLQTQANQNIQPQNTKLDEVG